MSQSQGSRIVKRCSKYVIAVQLSILVLPVNADDTPIKAGVLKFGTVNWENPAF